MLKLKEEFKKAEVVVRVRCVECEGKRIVQHPMWTLYWRVTEGRGDYERFFHNEGLDDVPDEEIECRECEGTGYWEKYVKLEEVFEEVGADYEARLEGLENAEMERTAEELMRFNVELYGGGE